MNDYSLDELNVMLDLINIFERSIYCLFPSKECSYSYEKAVPKLRDVVERQNIKTVNVINNSKFCPNCGQRIDVTKTSVDKLFGVKNINTGEVIFNARGGAYHTYDAALKKRERLGEDDYKVVTYKLSNNN
jgi:hypothetical protein